MLSLFRQRLGRHSDAILVLAVVGILMILFIPIPSQLLDILLILNLCFGLLVLLLCFYVEKPLQFSTFPSLLLIATLFRLSLNIASTRLILNDADAGQVIGAIGEYVVAGNYVIGLIVFLVLIVVQYVVVTNGSQRVAEVAARFTLDSMPGKQMSIDADMNMGIIDEKEAQRRRQEIEKEGNFYGAMDGASKFVKGDAVAGIIIIIINIVGGLTIGIAQLGMSWGSALHTYTLLTVGDGIVTQIPALIISTGTGIIVTRAASDGNLSQEISSQITAYPKTLLMIIAALGLLLLLPGMPMLPVSIALLAFSGLAYWAFKKRSQDNVDHDANDQASKDEESIYSKMKVHPYAIELGTELTSRFGEHKKGILFDRIHQFRQENALKTGFVIPSIVVKENPDLEPGRYRFLVNGNKRGESLLYTDKLLAINPGNAKSLKGIDAKDPSYGLPALWISPEDEDLAISQGYTVVDAITVFMTHFTEVTNHNLSELLSRAEVDNILNHARQEHKALIDELTPTLLSVGQIRKVLQGLLAEKVSIRNTIRIFEALVDDAKEVQDIPLLIELVRSQLRGEICSDYMDEKGHLTALILDPTLESTLSKSLSDGNLKLDPRLSEQLLIRLASHVEKMMRSNHFPIIVCSGDIRRHLSQLVRRMMPHLAVISMHEVPSNSSLKSFALVSL